MTFLPIVARELRVASRRRSTYWMRVGAAVTILILGTCLFMVWQRQPPHDLAQYLFYLLAGGTTLYALLSGVRATADCLSEEKREGTLGLLFLTDLKGYDLVFGKLVASSVNAFYGVLAVVPMLAIPLLIGGITPSEFGRMALVTVNTLFFSLAVGVCVSSISRSAQKAMSMTLVLLLLITAGLPACGASLEAAGKTNSIPLAFLLPSPGFSFRAALEGYYRSNSDMFWLSLAVIHSGAWLCLAFASFMAPRVWQDRPGGAGWRRWNEFWQSWTFGKSGERANFRRRLLDTNAFYWLAARARWKPAWVWAVLGLVACAWGWGWAKYRHEWLTEFVYILTAVGINLMLRVWVAAEACRQLGDERRNGTLELLLSTPLSVRDILNGQRLALQRQFICPLIFALVVECVFMMARTSDMFPSNEHEMWLSVWVGGMLMLVADLVALYWIGMWQGLAAKNPRHAASPTLARVIVVPWALIAVVLFFLALDSSVNGHSADLGWKFFFGMWLLLGWAADLGFGAYARYKLLTEFRAAAERRYELRPGFWKRLFGGETPGAPKPPASMA